jgi:hypothetical protein
MPPCVTSRARLFADDCPLYRPIKTEADATKLQEDIDALHNWESTWQMSFNPDKCEILRNTNKRNKIMANYYIHGQQLQIVDNAKYVGFTISKISHEEGKFHPSLPSMQHLKLPTES